MVYLSETINFSFLNKKRVVTRLLFFIIFILPVAWYLFLQFFGKNEFRIVPFSEIGDCDNKTEFAVYIHNKSINNQEEIFFDRLKYRTNKLAIPVYETDKLFFECVNYKNTDFLLADKGKIWGIYSLSREDLDRFFIEVDILRIQNNRDKYIKK